MDYRSSIPDDEHPAGTSPWGSPPTTPQRNVTSYNSIDSSQSPAPYQYGRQESGNGFGQDDSGIDPFGRPNTANSAASTTEYTPSEQSEPSQQAGFGSGSEAQPQPSAPQQGKPSNNGAPTAPGIQQEQQSRRPPAPLYKLQAKITALERTGKKDPIIRFDVHVRTISGRYILLLLELM
jgi:hypothetical protein